MQFLHIPYYTSFETIQLETSAFLFLFDFCLTTINPPRFYQREANHISQPLRDLLCFFTTTQSFIGRCVKEGAHDCFDAFRSSFNAREAPRWLASNIFNVRFVQRFCLLFAGFIVGHFFGKCKWFFKEFCLVLIQGKIAILTEVDE